VSREEDRENKKMGGRGGRRQERGNSDMERGEFTMVGKNKTTSFCNCFFTLLVT
jgi:hypothetical protein